MDTAYMTIEEARQKLRARTISSRELTGMCLARIRRYDGSLHAFLTVTEDEALSAADEADRRIAGGLDGPLLGIPVALKDLFTTKGIRTTAGSRIIGSYVPPFDATVVYKLKEAGAVIVGKTNEDAWGHGSSGENTDYEPTRNPYDTGRVPGGSSSGSAAAVASGMCLMATGTDTGSSVRLPAAYCNLVGLKPTYGRVSRYGIIPMASSFDTIGHITRTVRDNAMVLGVTAGHDPYDATTADVAVPAYVPKTTGTLKGVTIGLPKEYYGVEGMDPDVAKTIEDAVLVFKKLGAAVRQVSLPHTGAAMACYYILVPSEISSNLARFDGVRFGLGRDTFGPEAKRRIMLGTHTLSAGYYDAYYRKASKVRTLIRKDFADVFGTVDALLVPSSPTPPFRIGEKTADPLTMYLSDIFLCPMNIAGVPSLSVPAGFTRGLPVGMQLAGPQFSEPLLYKIGAAFEKETAYYNVHPEGF
ncbi:Asp-tRNA(Asn)/Glu-tRNA(Gln) amidotransferase subunit GatA [Patescibacteria group bacterium]|nr:Asp-tRNA(Asn)/Glu-tRNA(Gln) amidotransferase subunit GatA [Patescibacteria group bacterium]